MRKTKEGWKEDAERARGERPSPRLRPDEPPDAARAGLRAGIRRARTRPEFDAEDAP